MSEQLDLLRPLAKHGGPTPSALAADALVASGVHRSQMGIVLAALALHGPVTSRELAAAMAGDRYTVARRLPDLLEIGYARKQGERACRVAQKAATVWVVTDLGLRALRLGLPVVSVKPARRRETA